jgi:hypothetical protein
MRKFGIVAGCVWLAMLVSGCDPARDFRYTREGIGVDLYWDGLPTATQLQDIYLADICSQAISPTARSLNLNACDQLNLASRDWGLLVQAGMNDIDLRCDAYLSWLHDKRSSREPILKELAVLGGAAAAILKITGSGATPIALTAIAFGLAADSFTNYDLRILNGVDYTTVQSVVRDNRNQFRIKNLELVIDNRPAAIYVLRNYLSLCVPASIEMSINNTLNVFHRGGFEALKAEPVGMTTPAATSSTSAQVRGTPVIRSAIIPLPVQPTNPVIVSPSRLNKFEQVLTPREINEFQKAVCVTQTGDLGPIDSETRVAIQKALNSPDQMLTEKKGILIRDRLGTPCPPR